MNRQLALIDYYILLFLQISYNFLGKLIPRIVLVSEGNSEYQCFYTVKAALIEGDTRMRDKNLPCIMRLLKRYVLGIVKDEMDSDDITAEVIMKILTKAEVSTLKTKADKQFKAWCYRIAYNHSIDFLRKKNREMTDDIEYVEATFSEQRAFDFEEEEQDIELLKKARHELTETEFKVMQLSLQGMSIEETADKLNLSPKRVRNCLTAIKKFLKNHRS